MDKLITTWLFLSLGITGSLAQQSLPASGSHKANEQGSASISIGQFACSHFSAMPGELNEGVQQPYEMFVITDIENHEETMLNLKAYPNPASRMLILQTENIDHKNIEYQLYDNIGKLLKTEKLNSELYIIPFQQYGKGIYYLNILSDSKPVKIFKIVKNE